MGYVIKIEFVLLYLASYRRANFAHRISLRNVNNTFGYNLLHNKKYRECCGSR